MAKRKSASNGLGADQPQFGFLKPSPKLIKTTRRKTALALRRVLKELPSTEQFEMWMKFVDDAIASVNAKVGELLENRGLYRNFTWSQKNARCEDIGDAGAIYCFLPTLLLSRAKLDAAISSGEPVVDPFKYFGLGMIQVGENDGDPGCWEDEITIESAERRFFPASECQPMDRLRICLSLPELAESLSQKLGVNVVSLVNEIGEWNAKRTKLAADRSADRNQRKGRPRSEPSPALQDLLKRLAKNGKPERTNTSIAEEVATKHRVKVGSLLRAYRRYKERLSADK
jgi:hypothetical protein